MAHDPTRRCRVVRDDWTPPPRGTFRPRWFDLEEIAFWRSLVFWAGLIALGALYLAHYRPIERSWADLSVGERLAAVQLTPPASALAAPIPEPADATLAPTLATPQPARRHDGGDLEREVIQGSSLLRALLINPNGRTRDLLSPDALGLELQASLAAVQAAELVTWSSPADAPQGPASLALDGTQPLSPDPFTPWARDAIRRDYVAPVPEAPRVVTTDTYTVWSCKFGGSEVDRAVKQAVRRYSGQLKYCYERSIKRAPDLEGRIEVYLAIERGRVREVTIDHDGVGDDELARCLTQKIRRWRLPADVEAEITLPFVFSP